MELGHPVRRKRRYSVIFNQDALQEVVQYGDKALSKYHRSLELDGRIYFSTPLDAPLSKKYREELATARQLPLDGPKPWKYVTLLSAGPFRCLAAYHQAMRDNGYFAHHDAAVVDISQRVDWVGTTFTPYVMALRRNSRPWLVTRAGHMRPMLPLEHWCAQGWHVPGVGPRAEANLAGTPCAFPADAIDSTSSSKLVQLAGNGMHKACIGTVLICALGSYQRRGPEASALC